MTPTPEEMQAARLTAEALNFLPLLRFEVERMQRAIDVRIYQQVRSGELTADAARTAWAEKAVLSALLSRFEQRGRLTE